MKMASRLIDLNIQILARAKSEALVHNTCKQKKLNRVMLQPRKRPGNEVGNAKREGQ